MHSFKLRRSILSAGRGALVALLTLSSIADAQMASDAGAYVWALDIRAPNGQHNLLMGSLHVPDRDLRQPAQTILRSYRVLVTEHEDVDAGVTPAVSWREALTADDVAMLRQQMQCMAPLAPATAVDNVLTRVLTQPTPLEAIQLAYQRCASAGYASRDAIVERAGMRYGLKPAYLETPEQAGDAPRALAREVGAAVSGQSVHFALSPAAMKAQADLVDAVNAGDYDAASAALDRSLAGAGINPAVSDDIMVRQRNVNWMTTLPPLLDQGGAFILVGVAHLPGHGGLIALLRARGYLVRPVKVPAGQGKLDDANGTL
ncbi:hypothetical protein PTKU46_84820 [Paraburkholderia terrae]|uniref:TraB/GumN family protein n=1 Tax=Paraburkholderia terrae TaxID=311230 RepID=UPI0030E3F1C2